MLTFLFWLLAICSVYSYFLYPLVLIALKKYRKPVEAKPEAESQAKSEPAEALTYSLIVTVFNEKGRVASKLENLLALEFDRDRLELIVASDSSDDGTDEIVKDFASKGIKLVRATERLGKENAQLTAIQAATGDVLVFSDVATIMEPDALQKLAVYFEDASIGAISSEDRFISNDGSVAGEGAYVKYEMWLRQQESQLGGLVGLSGSFFAARKAVCTEWDIHSPSDFNTALNCARLGLRSVSAPDVLGFYADLKDPSKEYSRKVRTVLRGMTGLSRHLDVLNISKFGFYAVQIFSHKLMRWGVPWFLIALFFVTSLIAANHWFFSLALIAQWVFYIVAVAAHFSPSLQNFGPIKLMYFFVQVNVALLDSSIKYFSGTRMTTWKPSAR